MSKALIPCPLGAQCRTGSTLGHEPGSDALRDCTAAAVGSGQASATRGQHDPTAAYQQLTDPMKRLTSQVKRAFGADGRGIPNLVGPPGIGKSAIVENMARSMNADYMIFDVSSLDPDIFNGIPYNPGGEVPEGMMVMAGRLYEREVVSMFSRSDKKDKPLLVFLDEINGGKEALMSSLQKVMTGRMLPQEGVSLNDNVFLVAAMNDADQTSNGNDLAAAMVSRLTPIPVNPNFDEWTNGELTFWGQGYNEERTSAVARALDLKAPTVEQHLMAAASVASYLEDMGNPRLKSLSRDETSMNLFSEPLDEDDLTTKVGQPRSWSKAISGIAMAIANPDEGESDTSAYADVIRSNCGERAARGFVAYHETHRDLPDIKGALDKGTLGDAPTEWARNGRSDIPMFTMSVLANQNFENDIEKMGVAVDLIGEIAGKFPDIAGAKVAPIVKQWTGQIRDEYGVSSEQGKALSTMLAEKINKKGNEPLRVAVGRSGVVAGLVDGRSDIDQIAVSAAKAAANDDDKKKN